MSPNPVIMVFIAATAAILYPVEADFTIDNRYFT
jgi:hypothetical protein